ncbi:MAG: GDCCVxC domain-containing (seleno)protein [Candidatus Sedimenticola sp. (ex Thyasira tokunagai)]
MKVILESTIRCPKCGHEEKERMPEDACQYFYECKGCGVLLRPLKGDCCVFCSFADVPCPPIQQEKDCCGG